MAGVNYRALLSQVNASLSQSQPLNAKYISDFSFVQSLSEFSVPSSSYLTLLGDDFPIEPFCTNCASSQSHLPSANFIPTSSIANPHVADLSALHRPRSSSPPTASRPPAPASSSFASAAASSSKEATGRPSRRADSPPGPAGDSPPHLPASASSAPPSFMTGMQKLEIDARTKQGGAAAAAAASLSNPALKRKFVPPYARDQNGTAPSSAGLVGPAFLKQALESWQDEQSGGSGAASRNMKRPAASSSGSSAVTSRRPASSSSSSSSSSSGPAVSPEVEELLQDERLSQLEPKLIESILTEILQAPQQVSWNDIGGLENAKKSVQEAVIWPLRRPDLFTGIRSGVKGLLMFGPPGTGKTMIARVLASEAGATFFAISASSMTSKWHGEGEKLVRALFAIARVKQPSVIFIDEIDSLLTARTDGEFEASRRIKTEFLICLDGVGTSAQDRVLIIGATNRPQDLDEAARRRLVKRLYIPLPDAPARATIIRNLLSKNSHSLNDEQLAEIVRRTDGYSGSDLKALCEDAGLGPMREQISIADLSANDIRPIGFQDFQVALTEIRASVAPKDLEFYEEWNRSFGSFR